MNGSEYADKVQIVAVRPGAILVVLVLPNGTYRVHEFGSPPGLVQPPSLEVVSEGISIALARAFHAAQKPPE